MRINKINKIFLISVILLLSLQTVTASAVRDFVVVLDAGHGGKDSGATGPYGYEKNVTLSVALKLGRELERKPNIKVIYTRTSDVFIELARRAQIANDAKADLFISLHCNSARPGASGTETWVLGTEENRESDNLSVVKRENSVIFLEDDYEKTYDGFDPNSAEDLIAMTLMQDAHYGSSVHMAGLIEQQFVKDARKSRGVKQSGFAVLWRTAMPSVLVEMGFISNPTEGQLLCSDHGQNEIAHSIEEAFDDYKRLWDKKNTDKEIIVEKPKEQPIEEGVFHVQILASDKLYNEGASQFRGLKNIQTVKKGNFYKYFYGETRLNSEKERIIDEVKKLGFTTAYPVLFKGGDTYKIEYFSSDKKYNPSKSMFDNVPAVERVKNSKGPKFSYYSTDSYTYEKALEKLAMIRKNGFVNAVLLITSD